MLTFNKGSFVVRPVLTAVVPSILPVSIAEVELILIPKKLKLPEGDIIFKQLYTLSWALTVTLDGGVSSQGYHPAGSHRD